MRSVGGADKVVVADVERGPCCAKYRADLIDERLGSEAGGLGGAFVLVAMFVGTGDERDVLSSELAALKTRERVGREHFVCVADVRRAVAVGDRAGDVDAGVHQLNCMRNPRWVSRFLRQG